MGERTPAETTFLHFLSALCLFTATRAFPHVTGVFLIVVVPPTVPAPLSAAAACYYGKNYSFCCVAGYYILCPTGTPTHCGAPRRNGRDLIIAKNDQRTNPYPHCCQRQRRKRYKRSLNRQQCHPPHQFREISTVKFAPVAPRKEVLKRSFKWRFWLLLSPETKVTRARKRETSLLAI